VVLAGVAGSGKTTVGRLLAPLLGVPFVDADDCHDAANRARMSGGEALDEPARDRWLAAVAARIGALVRGGGGFVLACSLLRQQHRDALAASALGLRQVHLEVDGATLRERLAQRTDHFFPASLLASQLAAWEPWTGGLRVDANGPPAAVAAVIRAWLASSRVPR
jgi:gluconokinase